MLDETLTLKFPETKLNIWILRKKHVINRNNIEYLIDLNITFDKFDMSLGKSTNQ